MTSPQRSIERPLIRRDADGCERTAVSWETLTERLIREAQEAGLFDDLPGHGRPLQIDDDRYAGDMAMANHVLRNAGAAPPWIEEDKAARRCLDAIEALLERAPRRGPGARSRLERELMELAEAYDRAARRLEGLAPTARQQRRPIDRARLRTRLDAALTGRDRHP
jgi:DnaJ homologue, subfamily C, member 28, conserved domain